MIRRFTFAAVLAAAALSAGCTHNPAPEFDAGADHTLSVPDALSKPGSQIKVRIPSTEDYILVWRTEIGFGACQSRCTHCQSELLYRPEEGRIACTTHGCRYSLDGSVLKGPAKKPLRAYLVDLQGERLKILG